MKPKNFTCANCGYKYKQIIEVQYKRFKFCSASCFDYWGFNGWAYKPIPKSAFQDLLGLK